MIDRTEQKRLLIILLKAPIQCSTKHICTSRAQNDALEATWSHSGKTYCCIVYYTVSIYAIVY